MIDIKRANYYCCEDISLIENYEKAVNDSNKWHCHHRREIDDNLTQKQLKAMGLYLNRPASELIFLTVGEHRKLHGSWNKGLRAKTDDRLAVIGKQISSAHIASGKFNGAGNPAAKAIKCLETGEEFTCMKYAKEKYHIGNRCSIVKSCETGKPIRGRGLTFT